MASQHHLEFEPSSGGIGREPAQREVTQRRAVAHCRVVMDAATTDRIVQNATAKGDVLATARVAGIGAAKRTAELLPMCQMVVVGSVVISFAIGDTSVLVTAEVHTVDRTGVEMEAMTAAMVAALTIYDMCKNVDRTMRIEHAQLVEKSGGRSGTWRRDLDLFDGDT